MTKTVLALALLLSLAGCGHVESAANEGQQALETGMRTSDKARDLGAQKESLDRQADDF